MKAKTFISLALFAILITSCEKEIARYYLTEAQKQIIPYEKGQIISFIYGARQTVNAIVEERELKWIRYDIDEVTMYSDYISCERKFVTLRFEPYIYGIQIYIDAIGFLFENNLVGLLHIETGGGTTNLRVDTEGFFLTNDISNFFYESIEINGKVYYDVVEQNSTSSDMSVMQLFYNKTYGILQINRDGENFLTINQ